MKKLLALFVVATMLATVALCAFSASAAGTNLALNKSYTGADPSPVAGYTASLTDGNAADSLSYDDNWFAFYYNADATPEKINAPDGVGTVIIDLGTLCAVESVRVNTYQGDTGDGILPPKSMKVEVSSDGETYTQIGNVQEFTAEKDSTLVDWVEFKADGREFGQFVKVTVVLNSVWGFINEIEVYGDEDSAAGGEDDGDETTSGDDENSETTGGEDSNETTGGEENTSSTSTPAASESTPSENDKPTTGDAGLLAFAALAVLAVAGSVVAIRIRH